MLSRISADRTSVVCPIIDVINDKTLEYAKYGGYQIGGFTWSLFFTWQPCCEREKSSAQYTDPIASPSMAGGLFAADRKFFFEVGAYDPGMDTWGGENLELSFRVSNKMWHKTYIHYVYLRICITYCGNDLITQKSC